jgi:hypothetical protein
MIEFEEFWKAYPRKTGRLIAKKKWARLGTFDREAAMKKLAEYKQTFAWQQSLKNDGGLYIPHASTFLNQRRWEDDAF